ncbi:MAG TPA: phosphoribosylformylglycinamidine synthase subunit PurS [Bacillales bacterium]|nr:phosphoribosylformylglycinamidine synthase subunit PurS [Bacillales bacterium]
MYKVKIYVTLKESVLDPQGSAVTQSLHRLSFDEVRDVRIGKYMEVMIETDQDHLDTRVREMCEKLLANTVIEDYRYEAEEVLPQ